MIEIWKRSELEKLMRSHGLRYSKSLGQNFLADRNTLEKIIAAAEVVPEEHIVEIGAGLGALTVLLARAGARVTAIEIDGRLMPALQEVTDELPNIELVNEDILKWDLPAATPYKIIGNLPYYITTPIVARLFEPHALRRPLRTDERQRNGKAAICREPASGTKSALCKAKPRPPALAVLMMQKEVAERLISPPGKKTYGAISVLVQYYAEAELLFEVSREVFVPRPNVDSAVICLRPRDISGDDPETAACMFRLVRAGFDMRRKTLRNSLSRTGFSEDVLLAAMESAGIDPARRAETLSYRDFYTLASEL
jgi:16S rRNA (adenine1518-N6/adenine1519-N6)-dimethyltransferase